MSVRPYVPPAPSGTTWGSPTRRRGLRLGTRLTATSAAVALGLALSAAPSHASTSYDPASDPYSMANIDSIIGANAWWDAGYTGAGVDVALIDTGVTPVEGLATAGKVVNGPDLSFESQAPNLGTLS